MRTLCVTGHRDLKDPEQIREAIRTSFTYFKLIDPNLKAISAIAAGADTIFAEEAILQNIPLQIVLPFSYDQYKEDFTDEDDRRKFEALTQSGQYEVVHTARIENDEEKNKAYLAVGYNLVDRSDIVIAIWNGQPADGVGGTGDIVEYARKQNKELHIVPADRISKQIPPDTATKEFNELDTMAVRYKTKKFEPAWIGGIVSGLVAISCFAVNKAFHFSHTLSFVLSMAETVFLFTSFFLLVFRAKKWKNRFLISRRNAEYLRPVLLYRNAGIPIPTVDPEDFKPVVTILTMEKNIAATIKKVDNLPNAKRFAWTLARQQKEYHQKMRIDRFEHKMENMEKWMNRIKYLFFIVAGISCIVEIVEYCEGPYHEQLALSHPYLLLLALILPPLFAALEGIKYFGEWKRNIGVSKKIVKKLEDSEKDILKATDETFFLRATHELRNILEMENSDWAVRYDEKEVDSKPG